MPILRRCVLLDLEGGSLEGMQLDPERSATGLLYKGSPAIEKIREQVKPKSEERILNEYRTGLKLMAEMGFVEYHDMFRSFKEVERYLKLQENGRIDLPCLAQALAGS